MKTGYIDITATAFITETFAGEVNRQGEIEFKEKLEAQFEEVFNNLLSEYGWEGENGNCVDVDTQFQVINNDLDQYKAGEK